MTFRIPSHGVVLDGQSLLFYPQSPGETVPELLAAKFSGVRCENRGRSGIGWSGLAADASWRLHPWLGIAKANLAIMLGGTSDLFWEVDSGAKLYKDMADYADAMKAVNADLLVIATTITPSTAFFGSMDPNRQDANPLILADARGSFDAVTDLAGTTGLDNAGGAC